MRMIQDETRKRRCQDRHNRVGRLDQRNRPRSFLLGEPVRQIQDDSREITCLGQAKKKACNVQLMDSVDEAGQRGHNPPTNQDFEAGRNLREPV